MTPAAAKRLQTWLAQQPPMTIADAYPLRVALGLEPTPVHRLPPVPSR